MNYQEKVSTREDVRVLYEKVKANPAIKQYRGYTETKSYGWDPVLQDCVKMAGEAWFDNPTFDAGAVSEGVSESVNAELLDEQLAEKEQRVLELEALLSDLENENKELELSAADAEARAKAAENERDEAKEALLELRRALVLVGELAASR